MRLLIAITAVTRVANGNVNGTGLDAMQRMVRTLASYLARRLSHRPVHPLTRISSSSVFDGSCPFCCWTDSGTPGLDPVRLDEPGPTGLKRGDRNRLSTLAG